MDDTLHQVLASMKSVKRPQRQFLMTLFSGFMSFVGHATFRNLSRYTSLCEKTLSRWFRRDFDFSNLNTCLLQKVFGNTHPFIATIDASFLSKSGKKTSGLAMFWNGSSSRAEKGLEISTLAVVDVRGRTGYAINTQQTIDSDNDETPRIVQYIQQIRDNQSALQMLRVTHLVADGYYSKSSFIDAVTSCGFQYVGKLRRDANLWWPYNGQQNKRGRKRKYGDKVDINDDISQWHECYTEDDGTRVYSAQTHSKFLKRCINVVLMRRTDQDNKQRQAILFSTDTKLDAKKLLTDVTRCLVFCSHSPSMSVANALGESTSIAAGNAKAVGV